MPTFLITNRAACIGALALILVSAALPGRAQLLTPAYETQLENWLGRGNLTFTNLFTKIAGDDQTAVDFHAAADNQGETFVLLQVGYFERPGSVRPVPPKIVGGYNPRSWNSSGTFNTSPTNSERTAFIFNLTDNVIQRQDFIDQGILNYGYYQTYNSIEFGPVFGGGYDLITYPDMTWGEAANYSYGANYFGLTITNFYPFNYGENGRNNVEYFEIFSLEVYSFSESPVAPPIDASAVPEPSTYGLIGAAFLLAIVARRHSRVARA